MLTSTGRFETRNGSKYLQQLGKHFGHKIEVTFDDKTGEFALPPGPATLTADDTGLSAQISAQDDEGLKVAKHIIDNHLERFAFREEFRDMNWQDAPAA